MCEKTYNNNKEKILTEDFSDNEDMDNSKNFSFSDEDSISEKRSSELSNINENNNFDKFLEEFHKLNMCCDTSLNKVYKEETNESKAEDENLLQKNKFFNKREGKDILHILKNNKPHKKNLMVWMLIMMILILVKKEVLNIQKNTQNNIKFKFSLN